LDNVLAGHQGTIPTGTPVTDIWNRNFGPCAKLHNVLVLVDRYVVAEVLRRPSTGLARLVAEIDAVTSPTSALTVFTAVPEGVTEPQAITSLSNVLLSTNGGGLAEFELYITDDHTFSTIAHYRYLRFGGQICCILDAGISILEGISCIRPHVISAREFGPTLRDNENQLRARSRAYRLR
jgi:hypothetical protein